MNQTQLSIEHVKQIKCPKHNYQPLDLIDLTGNSPNGRVCLICTQQNNIPSSQYLSIYQLFQQEEVSSSYPPFKSKDIRDLIQKYCSVNVQKSNIDSFFCNLREDIEAAIQEAEHRAKSELIKNENSQEKLRKEINKIAQIDKLKHLLVSGNQDLNTFLEEKWNNAEENDQLIQKCLRENQGNYSYLNLDQRQKEVSCHIQFLQQLSLFDSLMNQIPDSILFQPSQNFNDSLQQLQIQRQNNEIVIKNISVSQGWRQCYLQQALEKNKRYVLTFELNNIYNDVPYFYFALVNENDKDTKHAIYENLYYQENSKGTISKMKKGISVRSPDNLKQIGKKKLEFRVHLDEYIVKVSSPPNYDCISKLMDKSLIDLRKNYHFAILINNPGDSVTVENVVEVASFNSNM